MVHNIVNIQCSNPNCKALNDRSVKVCAQCGTPLIKRYLWTIRGEKPECQTGDLVSDRYLYLPPGVFLDTKPGLPPILSSDFPDEVETYQRLFGCRPHIPTVYGLLLSRAAGPPIWLLDYGTVPTNDQGELEHKTFIPTLDQAWSSASALQQLNWLWQLINLWAPLLKQKVASTLLDSVLVRVNGPILQVLELKRDTTPPTVKQLVPKLYQLIIGTQGVIKTFLEQLVVAIEKNQITAITEIETLLAQAMYEYGQRQRRSYEIYALTDKGNVRDHNEDSCYPGCNTLQQMEVGKDNPNPLVIVCDGLGGQDGGEIASGMAIEYLERKLINLKLDQEEWQPKKNTYLIEKTIGAANDIISQRNDKEKRQERQRMGTTLVMALAKAHELYLTHVGDSRIYLVTSNSCHQITVDDDLASRDVRTGRRLYKDAIQDASGGALLQALGMSSSVNLHINSRRWVMEHNNLLILCSDGLSDFDRVEQFWRLETKSLFEGNITLEDLAKRFIEIANHFNGHDNITVALMYSHVEDLDTEAEPLSFPDLPEASVPSSQAGSETTIQSPPKRDRVESGTKTTRQKTTPPSAHTKLTFFSIRISPITWVILITGIVALGIIHLWMINNINNQKPPDISPSPGLSN